MKNLNKFILALTAVTVQLVSLPSVLASRLSQDIAVDNYCFEDILYNIKIYHSDLGWRETTGTIDSRQGPKTIGFSTGKYVYFEAESKDSDKYWEYERFYTGESWDTFTINIRCN